MTSHLESILGPTPLIVRSQRDLVTVRMYFFFTKQWCTIRHVETVYFLDVECGILCILLCVSGEHGQSEASMSVVFVSCFSVCVEAFCM